MVTYRGGIPARRRSPISALTGLNVEQLRSCDERRYHSAKPPNCYLGHVKNINDDDDDDDDMASYLSKVTDFNPPHLHLSPLKGVIPFEFRCEL